MVWGLAEQDAEKRSYKAGITDGAEQAKFETDKNFIIKSIPIKTITESTGLSLETIWELDKEII